MDGLGKYDTKSLKLLHNYKVIKLIKVTKLKQGDFVIPHRHLLNLSNELNSVCYLDKGPENAFIAVEWKAIHGAGIVLKSVYRNGAPFQWVKILTSRGTGWCYNIELKLFKINK